MKAYGRERSRPLFSYDTSELKLDERWKFNVAEVYDWRGSAGGLDPYFEFVRDSGSHIAGDFIEVGVYRGRSLIGLALALRELGFDKRVWGYDTFSGFPEIAWEDDFQRFHELAESGQISAEHYSRVRDNAELLGLVGRSVDPRTSSSSKSFQETSEAFVLERVNALGVNDYVRLVKGPIEETMMPEAFQGPQAICGALLDCDLYNPYTVALPAIWERLSPGGYVFLDEYYSLKFPGPRRAVDEFASTCGVQPVQVAEEEGWERYALIKS